MDHVDANPERLAGTWHIVCSSFPMWLGGRRTDATSTYTPLPGRNPGPPRMRDEVAYRVRGRTRRIPGTDTRLTSRPGTVYRWRGKGLLAVLTSVWEVRETGEDDAWAVIAFTRSLLTPAGVDVVVRADRLTDRGVLAEAKAAADRYGAEPLPLPDSGSAPA
ncbi:hypothetical protein [Streptomyces sp. ITFR-6]|uniref:hypothetical protein n=1 Tax=Streptomyces sp. ITFR-6 TaxID=3075197 RepID=UPI00288BD999|nr:hypothetical protein [Streptomyces sp. ITFR-6]WNI28560.1 hypothetical protein RLT59_07015 [Streptomyces sp. ITFR-6]